MPQLHRQGRRPERTASTRRASRTSIPSTSTRPCRPGRRTPSFFPGTMMSG
ncbi:hypothetical protein LV779_20080 [Streptomyces thinghirensis]|nr:hypothetical protein [Streptomyces thinghirensis]